MGCGPLQATVFTLGLIAGTGTTITGKVLYGLSAPGLNGEIGRFEKPALQTWGMFVAMVFALPIHYAYQWYSQRNKNEKAEPVPAKLYWMLAIPSIFDLLGTQLQNIGLLYVPVSTFQLMRSTAIIFVAILKVVVLKHTIKGYMWFGVFVNTVAVILVGMTGIFSEGEGPQASDSSKAGFGIFFVVLSCAVQSGQYVFEEFVMSDGGGAPPMLVVGMEGFWGVVLTSFVVFPASYFIPGSDHGSMESFSDGWTMLMNSKEIQTVWLLYMLAILGFNVCAILTTYLLDSVWHAILDNFRPVTVWGFDLMLFYIFSRGQFGEPWTVYSWLQLAGMLLLMIGTAIYNGSIVLSCFEYDFPEEEVQFGQFEKQVPGTPTIRTPVDMSSSMIARSPLLTKNVRTAAAVLARTPESNKDDVRTSFLTEYHNPKKSLAEEGNRFSYGSFSNT